MEDKPLMLTSLVLHLTAPRAPQGATFLTLPASLGRVSQAIFFDLLPPQLAQTLHADHGLKPYTVSNLIIGQRARGEVQIKPEASGWLRFTGLNAAVSEALIAIAAQPPKQVEILGQKFTVSGATLTTTEHPWAAHCTFESFAANYLQPAKSPARQVKLNFVSPTTFRHANRFEPFPLPHFVFGSLLDHWQTFAPFALHYDRTFAEFQIGVTNFELRSRSLPYKAGGHIMAFTGHSTFTALNDDPYYTALLNLLAAFAFYAGVGYQTTSGLGQVKPEV